MIQGGWVCRACWKSNRPEDARCYRCKTPREQQMAVEAGSLKERTQPGYKLRGRMDAQLGLLAMVVAFPMLLSAWLGMIGGVLLFVYALLELISGDQEAALGLGVIAAVIFVISLLWRFISRSVRRHARWAYAIAAVVYLLPSAPWLLGLVDLPREYQALPEAYFTIQTVIALIYLALGIGATVLLIASFLREDRDEAST